MLSVTTFDPELLGTGFARTRFFAVSGCGFTGGNPNYKPTAMLIMKLTDETFQPLNNQQVLGKAEECLRQDLAGQFTTPLFSVNVSHIAPLPSFTKNRSVFVSAEAYAFSKYTSGLHKIKISEICPVDLSYRDWETAFNTILDSIELSAKRELLEHTGSLEGYGVDWLTFTCMDTYD